MFSLFVDQVTYWVIHFNQGHALHLFGLMFWEDGSFSTDLLPPFGG